MNTEVEKVILPHINYISNEFIKSYNIVNFDKDLWKIVKTWREYFILYTEIKTPIMKYKNNERDLHISPELKEAISESLTKTLEKRMK